MAAMAGAPPELVSCVSIFGIRGGHGEVFINVAGLDAIILSLRPHATRKPKLTIHHPKLVASAVGHGTWNLDVIREVLLLLGIYTVDWPSTREALMRAADVGPVESEPSHRLPEVPGRPRSQSPPSPRREDARESGSSGLPAWLCRQRAQQAAIVPAFNRDAERIASLEAQVYDLKQQLHRSQCQVTYWRRRADDNYKAWLEVKDQQRARALKAGQADRYFSKHGGFTVALRRAAAHSSAASIGLVLGLDVSGKTVVRYELLLRAALLSEFKRFLATQYDALRDAGPKGLKLSLYTIRADATNANVWQKSKLMASEIAAEFLPAVVLDQTTWNQVVDGLAARKILAPLHVVKGTESGLGMIGMLEQQMKQTAVPLLTDAPRSRVIPLEALPPLPALPALPIQDAAAPAALPAPALAALADAPADAAGESVELVPRRIFLSQCGKHLDLEMYLMTTDAGADIAAAKRIGAMSFPR